MRHIYAICPLYENWKPSCAQLTPQICSGAFFVFLEIDAAALCWVSAVGPRPAMSWAPRPAERRDLLPPPSALCALQLQMCHPQLGTAHAALLLSLLPVCTLVFGGKAGSSGAE